MRLILIEISLLPPPPIGREQTALWRKQREEGKEMRCRADGLAADKKNEMIKDVRGPGAATRLRRRRRGPSPNTSGDQRE